MLKKLAFTLSVLASAEAAGQQRLQAAEPPPQNLEHACIQALATRADLASIANKVALADARDQLLALKTRADRVTTKDKPIIIAWLIARRECFDEGYDWRLRYDTAVLSAYDYAQLDFER